jgi:hypothetical protein
MGYAYERGFIAVTRREKLIGWFLRGDCLIMCEGISNTIHLLGQSSVDSDLGSGCLKPQLNGNCTFQIGLFSVGSSNTLGSQGSNHSLSIIISVYLNNPVIYIYYFKY